MGMRKLFLILFLLPVLVQAQTPMRMLVKKSGSAPPPNTNPGTLQTGTSWASDVPSVFSSYTYSVSFNGASTSRVTPLSSIVLAAGGSALSIWFNYSSIAQVLASNSSQGNTYIYFSTTTTIDVQTDNTATAKTYTVPAMSSGTWYNLILTRDGSNNTHLYLNGTESSSGGQSQTINFTINQLGRYFDGAIGSLNWSGKISSFYVFNTLINGTDISNLAAGTAPVTTPVLWWKMNEGTGTSIIDYY